MRVIPTILIIFLAKCMYLHTAGESGFFDNIIDTVSRSCTFSVKAVSIILYTSNIPQGKNIGIKECCDDLDPSKPIVFVVHGFISSANTPVTHKLVSQLIKNGYTVFALDWSDAACKNVIRGLRLLGYSKAVENTREIGHHMASYVTSLIKRCGVPLKNITLVGHSLGAQVCSFAAKKLRASGHGTPSLLIGADPASPLFMENECDQRFCKSDAKRVVALHTSALGIPYPVGHHDLYFNGGHMQPGCPYFGLDIVCSHSRAVVYLSAMLNENNCRFPGVSMPKSGGSLFDASTPPYPGPDTTDCISLNRNVFDNNNSKEGAYYVFVESKFPHCTQKPLKCQQ